MLHVTLESKQKRVQLPMWNNDLLESSRNSSTTVQPFYQFMKTKLIINKIWM
jgi:hypothetical protein